MDVMLEMREKGPAIRKIEEIEHERTTLEQELHRVEEESSAADIVSRLDEASVAAILARLRLRPTRPEVAPVGHQKH